MKEITISNNIWITYDDFKLRPFLGPKPFDFETSLFIFVKKPIDVVFVRSVCEELNGTVSLQCDF